ncbi:MAG: putative PurR-regulated permease PerM [Cryomorphaceae bacterium]|jgi:predicted PurR-regulated permease PerM
MPQTHYDPKLNTALNYSVEIAIRLGLLVLMVLWCFDIVSPFSSIILWSIILSMAFSPLFNKISKRLGGKPKTAAAIMVGGCLLLIILPTWLIFDSLFEGFQVIKPYLESDSFQLPPPSEQVTEWPLIGQQLFDAWTDAYDNLEGFIMAHEDGLLTIGKSIAKGIAGISGGLFVFVVSILISGLILATNGSENFGRLFFKRLVGVRGDEFAEAVASTIRSVVKGVIGVAIIQSLLIGLGMVIAGVPYAGVWTLVTLVFAILQLPVIFITIGVILWMFSSLETLPAVLWTIYFLAAGLSDNVLKPILLGKGAKVPMMVIFFGVIGGFIASGFIGLFTGAVVVSLGYMLFMSWINTEGTPPSDPVVNPNN